MGNVLEGFEAFEKYGDFGGGASLKEVGLWRVEGSSGVGFEMIKPGSTFCSFSAT